MEIKKADISSINAIRSVAFATWPHTFASILSTDQINYMLEMMYSVDALTTQMNDKGHHFVLMQEEAETIGFASFELNYNHSKKCKIHKLYLMPDKQGKGLGRLLIHHILEQAKANGCNALTLNVNRFNTAVKFYEKAGFKIIDSEDIQIGNGYLMEDFVMEKII